jgi:hypothetical protein
MLFLQFDSMRLLPLPIAALMKILLGGLIGLIFGAITGAAAGVGAGLIWTEVFQTSSFEGYSGMLVFFTFMPIGSIFGGMIGCIGLGFLSSRDGTA